MNKIGDYLSRIPGDYYLAKVAGQTCATLVTEELDEATAYAVKWKVSVSGKCHVIHVVIKGEVIEWSIVWPKPCKLHRAKKLLPVSYQQPKVTVSAPYEAVRPRSLRQRFFARKEGCYYLANTKGMEDDPFLVSSNLADAVAYAKDRQPRAQFRIRVVYVVIDEEIIQSTIVWPKLGKTITKPKRLPIRYGGNVGRNGER
jgi:hypothetical protein